MFSYYLFRVGAFVGPYIPVRLGFAVCDLAGFLVFWLFKSKRRVIMCNLSHVLPDKPLAYRSRVGWRIVQNNLKNYLDLFRGHKLTLKDFEEQVEVNGLEYVNEVRRQGRGVIAFAAHLGSFSFVSQVALIKDQPFNLVTEVVEPPKLFDFIRKLRETSGGSKTIPASGPELRKIFRALKQAEIVGLAIDRDVTNSGVPQKFFGADAVLPIGAAELALRTGAALFAVHCYRVPGYKNVINFYPPIEIEPGDGDHESQVLNVNAQLLREIERLILQTPDQWVVLQPVWPDCD